MELFIGDVALIAVFCTVDPINHLLGRAHIDDITVKTADNLSSAERCLLHQFQHPMLVLCHGALLRGKNNIRQLQGAPREHLHKLPGLPTNRDMVWNNECIREHVIKCIPASVAKALGYQLSFHQKIQQLVEVGLLPFQHFHLAIVVALQFIVGKYLPEQSAPNHKLGDGNGMQFPKSLDVWHLPPILILDSIAANCRVKSHHIQILLK